jgi:thiosulfate/3-mercaptopyruvate sulfurtransferase
MQIRFLAAILGGALVVGCADEAAEGTPRDDTATPAAQPDLALEDVFVDRLPADAQILYVGQDMDPAARQAGAVFVPFSTFAVERDGIPNVFPPADSMAAALEEAGVYGDGVVIVGDPIPAGRAYAAFDYLGLADRVALLNGGMVALDGGAEAPGAAQPQTPDQPPARAQTRGQLDTRVRDDMVVDAEWVHERLDDPDIVILDARPPAEFTGETPGEAVDRPGHIPGARNVFWQTLVESPENPHLRDEAELRRIFEEAGVGPDHTIVAYCRTGGQSAFLYAVARHLGYDVVLYDRSYVDWARTDYPVER